MYCKKYIAIFNEGTTDIDISLQVFMVSLLFKKDLTEMPPWLF